jgi:hypothetical protein
MSAAIFIYKPQPTHRRYVRGKVYKLVVLHGAMSRTILSFWPSGLGVRALPRYIDRQGATREEASPPSLWRTASMARPHMPENGSGGAAPLHPLVLPILLRVENAHIAEESPQGLVCVLHCSHLHSCIVIHCCRRGGVVPACCRCLSFYRYKPYIGSRSGGVWSTPYTVEHALNPLIFVEYTFLPYFILV